MQKKKKIQTPNYMNKCHFYIQCQNIKKKKSRAIPLNPPTKQKENQYT